jgi:serpin B
MINTKKNIKKVTVFVISLLTSLAAFSAETALSTAGMAINALGIDLLHQMAKADSNIILSPYSIQNALAMTYAGSSGVTREEMTKVLHYPANEAQVHAAMSDLQKTLEDIQKRSQRFTSIPGGSQTPGDMIQLNIANRLYGQKGYPFRDTFLNLVKDSYHAPLEQVDFRKDANGVGQIINSWIEEQTKNRIHDVISPGALSDLTRLVLVNAIYLKAPWMSPFQTNVTKPQPFHAKGGPAVDVTTMTKGQSLGYAKYDGFTAVTIPYNDAGLHFLILLPDDVNGLAALEHKITDEQLARCASLSNREVIIYLPKFKVESPTMELGSKLQALGMKTAFDTRTADFDRMAPKSAEPLYISAVYHKTFMNVDEKGTEAAAATAVSMKGRGMPPAERPQPIEVRVDHPFILAIQHRDTGACLFIGHIADPR